MFQKSLYSGLRYPVLTFLTVPTSLPCALLPCSARCAGITKSAEQFEQFAASPLPQVC